jgi:hypothetical protein
MTWRDQPSRTQRERPPRNAAYDGEPTPRRLPERRSPERRSLITPTRITLAIAVIGSIVYLVYAVTVRDTRQIPLLASGAIVLGLVFVALAVAGGVATYHAGQEGRLARALLAAIGGGVAGIVAAGAFAFGLVLVLAYRG